MSAPSNISRPLGAPPAVPSEAVAGIEPSAARMSLGDQIRHGRVLVAVTGGPDTVAPVAVARALQQRYATAVSAIQVMDTSDMALPAPLPSAFTLARELIGDAPYAADSLARQQQFAEILGEPNDWPVHISVGTPAQEILRHAEAHGSALIVMGLRRHGVVDRVLHDETTLTVARRAHATVLGVVPGLRGLPRTAVIGVDFGPASILAARAALDVLAPSAPGAPATLRLAYVDLNLGEGAREEPSGEALIRRLGIAAAFEQLVRKLDAPPTVTVDWTVLHGQPGTELLAFATESAADLIAVGSLRHERVERWILGSVTTQIIRDGRCSVLVIPPEHPD